MDQQDEIDRESISLFGLSKKGELSDDEGDDGPPMVELDKKCMSCTGQINFVKKAFKIACLAYQPSKILYDENVFSRKELLSKKIELQSQMKRMIGFNAPVFLSENVSRRMVFKSEAMESADFRTLDASICESLDEVLAPRKSSKTTF